MSDRAAAEPERRSWSPRDDAVLPRRDGPDEPIDMNE